MQRLNTNEAVTKIESAFKDAGIRPLCSIKNLLVENTRFQNNPRNKRRYLPILPTTIDGNRRYYLASDVATFAQRLIEISNTVGAG